MNVSLTPELEALVNAKVATGMYHSASEVICEGLRLIQERDALQQIRLEELRKDVRHDFEQIERGEYTEYASGAEVAAKIKAEGRKRVADRERKQALKIPD